MSHTHSDLVAEQGFNRWLIPPAALAIHLCIGMAYGFSVFWIPLSQAIGVSHSFVCGDVTFFASLFTTQCDWAVRDLAYIFMFFFIFLGIAAFFGGSWLESVGPRKGAIAAMFFWCGGLVLGALGVKLHQLWLLWFGVGIIGGIGLGLGYISPVSTLVRWFPDKPGMAVGISIMGFGGGSIVGAPLANVLMNYFRTPTDVGVWQTFLVMACISSICMFLGSFGYRLPSKGYRPKEYGVKEEINLSQKRTYVDVADAHYTIQFWMMCCIFFIFSASGVGVTSVLAPMIQEIFGGTLIGYTEISFRQLTVEQKIMIGEIAAGFTGFLFLFNLIGRFIWPYLSDWIGRKKMCCFLFCAGALFYALLPSIAHMRNQIFFTVIFSCIMSFYGGGIAMMPAYLSDIFGTRFLGAIHGRLLGASIFSGIIGPFFVTYMRQYSIDSGILENHAYDRILYIIAFVMLIGAMMNFCITSVDKRWLQLEGEQTQKEVLEEGEDALWQKPTEKKQSTFFVVCVWLSVILPFLLGVWVTFNKSLPLFVQKTHKIEQKR